MAKKILIAATAALLATPGALAAASANNGNASMARTSMQNDHGAWNMSGRGDAQVHALNVLEAAGYRHISNVRAQGRNFVATASKAGKSCDVTVMPSGKISTSGV